ncbi:MAG: hypothetical protein JWO06_2166 [Bacteroidota bacterium]|nr:hypothetical protein [Bacteroidota bacterium]
MRRYLGICIVAFSSLCLFENAVAQSKFGEWAKNPLGFQPLGLESGHGFYWGTAAIASTFLLGEIFSKRDTLTKYRISVFEEPGISIGYGNRKGIITTVNNLGMQYRVLRWMAVGGEVYSYIYQGPLNNTVGFGARPFARWYIVHKNSWDLFFEYGAGIIWNLQEFPITSDPDNRGTHFNFTPKYGLGVEFRMRDKLFIEVGLRHVHVSNAFIFGPDRNPAYDSDGFFIAVRFDDKCPPLDKLFEKSKIAWHRKRKESQL